MQINSPLSMNDWEIKKFLRVVFAIQFAVWGVIGLDTIGLQIPILREFIGFIYLTVVPGIIILRILKLHKLGNIETVLYTVGLSIATLMFTGFFMNCLYPLFGISGPISMVPLIITISAVVLILCVLSYVRDKDFHDPSFIDLKNVLSPPALFLCLIPFLSIFGTYLVNFHQTSILLMLLIVIIALIVLLIGFDKFIPKNLYPLAVFVIALSLLFYRTLISMYISAFDIHYEYYLANLTIKNSWWDTTIPTSTNALLSVIMCSPIFSKICSMNLTWIFKIIYPFLFSLVPLGLYRVYQKQSDDKIAFLACFFFVSVFHFYTDMPVLLRQQIATIFLILLILLMIDRKMSKTKRAFLFIIFGASLVVSHYGLSYIYMFCLVSAWLILVLAEMPAMQKLSDGTYSKFGKYKNDEVSSTPISPNAEDGTISSTFVLLFVVFAFSWYLYISSSTIFNAYINMVNNIVSSMFTDFFNPETSQGLSMLLAQPKTGLLQEANRVINYLNQIFIVIGVLVLLLEHRKLKFKKEYAVFSILCLVILFAGVLIPHFTKSANIERLYHILLIFLAPCCVIGGLTFSRVICRVVKKASWTNKSMRKWLKVLSVYFVIFFLYQTGFVWEVTESHSGSCILSQQWFKNNGDAEAKDMIYTVFIPEQEIFSTRWLSMNMNTREKIYATYSDIRVHALTSYGMIPLEDVLCLSNRTETIQKDAYVYLRYVNVIEGVGTKFDHSLPSGKEHSTYNMTEISHLFEGKSKMYSNGGSEIYKYIGG